MVETIYVLPRPASSRLLSPFPVVTLERTAYHEGRARDRAHRTRPDLLARQGHLP